MRALSVPLLPIVLSLPALLFAGGIETAHAQERTSALTITVRAAHTAQPLPGAQVIVQGVGMGGVTDQSGVIHLTDLHVGTGTVEVRFLGYAPGRATVMLQPGRTATLAFDLTLQPIQLAAVTVRTPPSILFTNGFYERRGSGFGTFLTRQEIVAMRPRFLSDVLRRTAGINLVNSPFGGSSGASIRGAKTLSSCPIQYYVDGAMTGLFNIDEVRPEDVEGLEIYRGAATIPPAFNKGSAMCGVIVIWTRVR